MPEPLWWWPRHINCLLQIGERLRFRAETNILWPGMPACWMRVGSGLYINGVFVFRLWVEERSTARRVVSKFYVDPVPATYQNRSKHQGERTNHDEWNVTLYSETVTVP